jgi:tetratricopeptide (TPR) repeat protein
MFCTNCGSSVSGQASFCPDCGKSMRRPQLVEAQQFGAHIADFQPAASSPKPKRRNYKAVFITLVAILTISGGAVATPTVIKEVQIARNVSSASAFFKEDDLEAAVAEIESALQLDPERSFLSEELAKLNSVAYSKSQFEKAERALGLGNYESAAMFYNSVRVEDSLRHSVARTKLTDLQRLWRTEVLNSARGNLAKSEPLQAFRDLQVDMDLIGDSSEFAEVEALAIVDYEAEIEKRVAELVKKNNHFQASKQLKTALVELGSKQVSLTALNRDFVADFEALQDKALDGLLRDNDSFNDRVWLHDRPTYAGGYSSNRFELYIGQEPNFEWLRFRAQFLDSRWVFADELTLNIDGSRVTVSTGFSDFDRDSSRGDVWETMDKVPTGADIDIILRVIDSDSTVYRFVGDSRFEERTVTRNQKNGLRNVLYAYLALGNTLPN